LQTLGQAVEFGRKPAGGGSRFGRLDRESRSPDLRARLLAHVVEELGEARDEIALGHQEIDRYADAQLAPELIEALADGAHLLFALLLALDEQVGRADGDDHAVDRLAAAELAQQLQEGAPAGGVGLRI